MKKFLSLILTVLMLLAMCASAAAEDSRVVSVTGAEREDEQPDEEEGLDGEDVQPKEGSEE